MCSFDANFFSWILQLLGPMSDSNIQFNKMYKNSGKRSEQYIFLFPVPTQAAEDRRRDGRRGVADADLNSLLSAPLRC